MTCLNCCALPPENIHKLRYVSSPINTLFTVYTSIQSRCYHKHPHLKATSCPIPLFCLWWQNIPVNGTKWPTCREVKCTCPHKDLLTAHLGPVLCPFSCIRLSLALVNTTLWYCLVLVLTMCWQRHKWELTLGIERGIFHFTYPHREMCWGCGNVYIRQSDRFSAGVLMRAGEKETTVH